MTESSPNRLEFDIRGQICPSTLLTALREVNLHKEGLRRGEVALIFVTDNRTATGTIPEAVRNMGYEVTVARRDGAYRIVIAGTGSGR